MRLIKPPSQLTPKRAFASGLLMHRYPIFNVKAIGLDIMLRHISHLMLVVLVLIVTLLSNTSLTGAKTSLPSYVPSVAPLSVLPMVPHSQYLRPPLVLSTFNPKRVAPSVGKPVASPSPNYPISDYSTLDYPTLDYSTLDYSISDYSTSDYLISDYLISESRQRIISYEVVEGDVVSSIAQRFGVNSATIVGTNKLRNANRIKIGQKLEILPVSGVLHKVEKGDTLEAIAMKYKVRPQVITESPLNEIEQPHLLSIGQKLVVPGGIPPPPPPVYVVDRPPTAAAAATNAGSFMWPTSGPVLSYFRGGHLGIDISPTHGSPIYAADSGTVIQAERIGWSYGWYLVIDHGNSFSTLYAHLSQFLVNIGNKVSKGQLIARVGNTGKSTGPHLHFEVWQYGRRVNPINYLPG